ncbi:MAG TPA: cellulase family glycosylhydrolase [Polyangiaceae bacterium]|nr:cellulase family glycosylhydrolase [Polyangiaceae bacterium]
MHGSSFFGLCMGALLALGACSSSNGTDGSTSPGGSAAGSNAAGSNVGGSGGMAAMIAGAAGSAVGGSAGQSGGSSAAGSAGSVNAGGTAAGGAGTLSDTFHVDGRFLYDSCGEKVLLRGVNEMVVWTANKSGMPALDEIAKTGANVVRIVWTSEGSAAELDAAIANAVAAKMIPLVEHHGATGKLEDVPTVVAYWTQADVVQVLLKHQKYLLLNIANEAGDDKVTADAFESAYKSAISAIRAQGVKVPLVIDAPSWGQDIDRLQASGPTLLTADPLHNLMFSVHMWWNDPDGARVKQELAQSADMGLPLLVGEFAQHAVYLCDQSPFAYSVLLDEAQTREVGWLVWSWGAVQNNDCKGMGPFDMTSDGTFGNWTGKWASDVAVDHPHSLKNSSVRPKSMLSGSCQ